MNPLHPKIASAYEAFEPETTGVFLAIRDIILAQEKAFTDELKYGLPFIYYQKKMFCYFWVDKKARQPYIGFMEGHRSSHPLLISGERKRVKILPLDTTIDLPYDSFLEIIKELKNSPYYGVK